MKSDSNSQGGPTRVAPAEGGRNEEVEEDRWPQGSSFIHGAFTRYPRKANPLLPRCHPPLDSLLLLETEPPASPCASLHHSLVLWNGSGSGGYNIFLKDSFSSAADHAAPPRPRHFQAAIRLAWNIVLRIGTREHISTPSEESSVGGIN